jgi:N-formylglutamate deformylase
MDEADLRSAWTIVDGAAPVVAAAIHNGHDLRAEVASLVEADAADRLREEDPYTERLTLAAPTRVVVNRSRFEVDLNRPVEEAICIDPKDCWGLKIWSKSPPDTLIQGSRDLHTAFYSSMKQLLEKTVTAHGRFVVLDIHSYNYRRTGPGGAPADPLENPDVNVGTGSLNRRQWGSLVDRFVSELSSHPLGLDVRENVKFKGRYLAAWVHEHFQGTGCCLAIEFKKTFMDEWTGELDEARLDALTLALQSTLPALETELFR